MSISSPQSSVCFIACHLGAADPFATFAERLKEEGVEVHIYASGVALKKLQDRNLNVIPLTVDSLTQEEESKLIAHIAKINANASCLITDVGNSFVLNLHKKLAADNASVLRLAYYDNPEPFVPGGYSKTAALVMEAAQKVLFANAHLAKISLYKEPDVEVKVPFENRVGLGYFPIQQAEQMAQRREKMGASMRAQLFSQYGVEDKGQKVFVYFGGNNMEYFQSAFPAFVQFLGEGVKEADLSETLFIMQQHPGAKAKNIDRHLIEEWTHQNSKNERAPKVIISDWNTEDIQVVAEGALYYQTSMGPLLALAGIPTLQVGHERYEDVLVRNHVTPSITNSFAFIKAISEIQPMPLTEESKGALYKNLGIRSDWFSVLKEALRS